MAANRFKVEETVVHDGSEKVIVRQLVLKGVVHYELDDATVAPHADLTKLRDGN